MHGVYVASDQAHHLKEHYDELNKTFAGFSHSLVFLVPKDAYLAFKKQSYTSSLDKNHALRMADWIQQFKFSVDF